jgi:hypothetical protein
MPVFLSAIPTSTYGAKVGGLPDTVKVAPGVNEAIRAYLMDTCRLSGG